MEESTCRLPYSLFLPWKVFTEHSSPALHMLQCVWCFCLGKPIKHKHPRFLWGVGHISTICLPCTQIPDTGYKQALIINHLFLQTVWHSDMLISSSWWGKLQEPGSQIQPRAALQGSLSKASVLRPFYIDSFLHRDRWQRKLWWPWA